MRCVLQRVSKARVSVRGTVVGHIHKGLVVLVGIAHTDTEAEVQWMSEKLRTVRLFPDAEGKMNVNVCDAGGSLLLVSQFTLYGTLRKGTRPSFTQAAHPDHALRLYNELVLQSRNAVPHIPVETGVFGEMMEIDLTNSGPVTIILERNSPTSGTSTTDAEG